MPLQNVNLAVDKSGLTNIPLFSSSVMTLFLFRRERDHCLDYRYFDFKNEIEVVHIILWHRS